MYKLLQKHGKKLLAIFSAVLMIAFILPTSSRYGGMGRNPIVGTVAGEKLTAQEMKPMLPSRLRAQQLIAEIQDIHFVAHSCGVAWFRSRFN